MGFSSGWTTEQVAAQLVIGRLNTTTYFEDVDYKNSIIDLVKMGIGGFCIFEGDTAKVPQMIEQLQSYSHIPLIFASDFEYGLPMRLSEGTSFPHAMAIGQSSNPENSFKIGEAIAKEALSIGVNWNLAPVCDINSNRDNPIINIRSFAEDANTVSEFAKQYMLGTQKQKVVASAKHFPGHGDTSIDSHIELPTISKTEEELERNELIPFVELINNGVWSIMMSHIYMKCFDDEKIPASLSKNVINYLRQRLNFKGIIITDALEMNAIIDNYGADDVALKALTAGCDVALMPLDAAKSIDKIAEAIQSNIELRAKLELSVEKLYNLKRKCGLIPQFAKLDSNSRIFNEHLKLALRIAYDSTKIAGDTSIIPLDEKQNFASIAVLQKDTDLQAANRFFTMLAQATENDCDFAFIDRNITVEDIAGLKEGISEANTILIPVFYKSHSGYGQIKLEQSIIDALGELSEKKKKIVILFGSPYIEESLDYDMLISTFSDSFASLASVVIYLTDRKDALNF